MATMANFARRTCHIVPTDVTSMPMDSNGMPMDTNMSRRSVAEALCRVGSIQIERKQIGPRRLLAFHPLNWMEWHGIERRRCADRSKFDETERD